MRHGVVRIVLGVLFLGGGILATMFVEGFYWWGAIVYGAYMILRGGILVARSSRTGWEHMSKKD